MTPNMQNPLSRNGRQITLFVAVLFAFGVIATRLTFLHVVDREEYLVHLDEYRTRIDELPARRGDILDRRGNIQATSQPYYVIGVDPHAINESDWGQFIEIASILNIEPSEVLRAFENTHITQEKKRRWVKLAERVDEESYRALEKIVSRGIYGVRTFERFYPGHFSAAHVLGMMNKEDQPVTGIERVFDFYLRGQDGWRETESDSRRQELAQFRTREILPKNGLDVVLTLDQVIQHFAESAATEINSNYKPDGISIIVSEVDTGSILAMSVFPNFDPNTYWKFPISHHRNRALTDVFEPGSTFKIVAASGALEEGLVKINDTFDTSLSAIEYNGRRVRLPRDHKAYDQMTMSEVVVKSSNRGVAFLGMLLGDQGMYEYSRSFGFGERTRINLSAEVSGVLHTPKNWDGLTISRLPMGHAVSATPVQVHMATSVIANDGIRMAPRIVESIVDEHKVPVVRVPPKEVGRVVSENTARVMTRLLTEVVSPTGTARHAQIPSFKAAGKTGTTQKIVNGLYSNQEHVSSFSGFFPAQRPEIVITIVVDNPKLEGVGYGGRVAGPVFAKLGKQIAEYLGFEAESYRTVYAMKGEAAQ
ncbi:MAG: penicillin-binding protein 2 [Verrucomicrobiota bacterium]